MAKKSIGLDVKPPEKKCEDRDCPWHGKVSIRGRVFEGTVNSTRAHNTAVIEWNFYQYIRKYERYERKHTRILAHNPPCIFAREGDTVIIAECRPLSKAKKFVVVGKTEKKEIGRPEKVEKTEEKPKKTKAKN